MKYLYYPIIYITLGLQYVFADGGILGAPGISDEDIRRGDIHLEDLGNILKHAIDWTMAFAGTIAVIAIIISAYKIMFGAVGESNSTTEGKKGVGRALGGFTIAALSWFSIKVLIDNFL